MTKTYDKELELNKYEDEYKIKEICRKINLDKFIKDLKEKKDYDCWDEQNGIYFNMSENEYKQKNIFEIYSLPYCTCLPLYCLNNFKEIKHKKLSSDNYNYNYAHEINLPNKCQNKFDYYSIEKDNESLNFIFRLFNPIDKSPGNKYLRFQKDELTQLPGNYYLLTISEITSGASELFHKFYSPDKKLELIGIILSFLFVIFFSSIVILYLHLRKISLIINEFNKVYEKYIYNSSETNSIFSRREKNMNNMNNVE